MKLSIRMVLPALLVLTAGTLTGCLGGDPPPDTPPPTATVGAAGQTVGAATIGTTAYPIPGGATFVSPTGSDSAAGTLAAPVRTVQRAVTIAPVNGTIVIRGGTYRERVDIQATKRLTMQPYPYEAVWFTGSVPVTGFVADGTTWRKDGWTAKFPTDGFSSAMAIGADAMAGHPDMAFIDGQPLLQVATRSAVVPGTFYVNEAASQLYIGSDPTSHSVEASALTEALNVQSSGSLIRGLGFMHYATSISHAGAVRGWNNITFENDVFTQNAAAGLTLRGDDTARRVTASFNGQLGIAGYYAGGSLIQDSLITGNNTDHINPESAAGGIKVTFSTYVTTSGNVVNDNYGHAIWYDLYSDHAVAVRNITRRNARGAGVMFEISNYVLMAGNISTDNEAGLQTGESSNVQVWNNTLVNNEYAFSGYEGARAEPVNIMVRNNILGAGPMSDRPVLINSDSTSKRSWINMAWTSDYNAFYRQSTTVTREATNMANWPTGRLSFATMGQVTSSTGQEAHSMAVDNTATNPYVTSPSAGDFRAPAGSPTINSGKPLPADVASALGQPAGQVIDIGAPIG